MLRKDFLTKGFNLALPDDFHAGALEAEIEPANACEKGSYS
ncbi:hypothetical protein EMIT0P2_90135 [Pseudomonas sp. IT-P2]